MQQAWSKANYWCNNEARYQNFLIFLSRCINVASMLLFHLLHSCSQSAQYWHRLIAEVAQMQVSVNQAWIIYKILNSNDKFQNQIFVIMMTRILLLKEQKLLKQKKLILKSNCSFTSCTSKVHNILKDNAKYLDSVKSNVSCIRKNGNYSMTSKKFWNY